MTSLETILDPNSELGQSNADVVDLSTRGPSPSPSPTNRVQSNSTSTPVGEGSLKLVHLVEDGERDALTPFFRLHAILPIRVPSIPMDFTNVVVAEDLDFV